MHGGRLLLIVTAAQLCALLVAGCSTTPKSRINVIDGESWIWTATGDRLVTKSEEYLLPCDGAWMSSETLMLLGEDVIRGRK